MVSTAIQTSERLVLSSDYGHWCNALFEPGGSATVHWTPRRRATDSWHPEQACLPYLLLDWVTDIAPLPTSGWDGLDPEIPL